MAEPKFNEKTKKYEGLVYIGRDAAGKRRYEYINAKSKREWKEKEAIIKIRKTNRQPLSMTVGECVDNYITSKEGVLSPSTIRGYRINQKKFHAISAVRVSSLTAPDLQYFVSGLSVKLSAKSVRNIYSLLMASIAQVDDRRFRVTLPTRPPVEYHTPEDEEVKLLLNNAKRDLKIAIMLASVGTLRRGEICALDYQDVFSDCVYVHRSAVLTPNGKIIIKDIPKTSGSVRRVSLPHEIISFIGSGEGLVYPWSPNTLTDQFIKLRNRLGLHCRFHDLRHYAASIMHAIGVPDQYIMARGGWSDDRVLKSVYRNVLQDKEKEFADQANSYFSSNILS